MSENKSILDGRLVLDQAFPLNLNVSGQSLLEIVSSCPMCGSPIYGPEHIKVGDIANVTYSCKCREKETRSIDFEGTISHK